MRLEIITNKMENKLWTAMKKETNKTLTENNALTFKSTESAVLNFFSMGGALRNRSPEEIEKMFSRALAEDKLLAIKCLCYLRDCRGGQGERRTFRICSKILSNHYPKETDKLLKLVPEYGRWDDLFYLDNIAIDGILKEQIKLDIASDTPSLVGKWLPSENASSKKTKELARKVRKYLGYSSKKYRKLLTSLRAKIGIVESKMSANKWKDIDYEKLPSKASMNYKDAFAKHNDKDYKEYIEAVKTGEKKINVKTLFPYEIVRRARDNKNDTLDVMWDSLPDYTVGNEKAIVVADVSGSMYGTPMDMSVSLAMYFAERNKGIFQNKFITFSGNPSLQEVKGKDLTQKIRNLEDADWDMNTDLQKVFDLILNTATEASVSSEDLPSTIYIISDMEFDEATTGNGGWRTKTSITNFEAIKIKYEAAGYKMPTLVFWNVDSRNDNVPVTENEMGVVLVSGNSPTVFNTVMKKITPKEFMLEVLSSERYNPIEEALK